MDEVRRLGALEGAQINKAKEVLAFELTKMIHNEEEAKSSKCSKSPIPKGSDMSSVPQTELDSKEIENGIDLLELLMTTGLTSSKVKAVGLYNKVVFT